MKLKRLLWDVVCGLLVAVLLAIATWLLLGGASHPMPPSHSVNYVVD